MAIKGLTDREASLSVLAIIRKGDVKRDTSKPGKDLEHFRFDPQDPDDTELARRFALLFGDEPRQFRAQLPLATTDEVFPCWREAWNASALQHRCDGETCVRWQKPDGTYSDEPAPCPGGCKQVGRLRLIIPELERLGYVTVQTTSIHDIINLTENLRALEGARGDLRGFPVLIYRRLKAISTPGQGGKRTRREKSLIFLEADPAWVKMLAAAQRNNAMAELTGEPVQMPALLAPPAQHDDADEPELDGMGGNPEMAAAAMQDGPEPAPDACPQCGQATPYGLVKKAPGGPQWAWACMACKKMCFDVVGDNQRVALMACATEHALDTSARSRTARLAATAEFLGRPVASWNHLSPDEAVRLADAIRASEFSYTAAAKSLGEAVRAKAAGGSTADDVAEAEAIFGDGPEPVADSAEDGLPGDGDVVEGELVDELQNEPLGVPEHVQQIIVAAGLAGLDTTGILDGGAALGAVNAYRTGKLKAKKPLTSLLELTENHAALVISNIERGEISW